MERICVNVVNPVQFFQFLKIGEMTFIQQPGILRRIGICSMDKQLYSANDPSASCTNMVNFGPVMPEIEV